MAEIYKVKNSKEALSLAISFQKEGKYDLFRGQAQNWSVISTMARLSGRQQERANEKLERFIYFLSISPVTEKYLKDANWFFAVAQHYGLPTSFIDFTKNPQVAMFFATNSNYNIVGKDSVIICLNRADFLRIVEFASVIYPKYNILPPAIIDIDVDNLWRLQAQEGVFLDSQIKCLDDFFYKFDRIIFPYEESYSQIKADNIYPKIKSELEIIIDHYFSGEERIIREDAINKYLKKMPDIKYSSIKNHSINQYVKSGLPHSSWNYNEIEKWEYKATSKLNKIKNVSINLEQFVPTSNLKNDTFYILEIIKREFSLNKVSRLYAIEIDLSYHYLRKKTINNIIIKNICHIWDGMRKLPYSRKQIFIALSKYLCMEIYSMNNIKNEISINPILLEMESFYGIHNRFYLAEHKIENAFREDILEILVDSLPKSVSSHILFYVNKPRIVFDFNKLIKVFADEIIPSQMLRQGKNKNPIIFFTPLNIKILGYA